MLKALVAKLFLHGEIEALKARLNQATTALNNIEKTVISVGKDAPVEVHTLAEQVLQNVLDSADSVREKATGFVHAWEAKAYADYKAAENDLFHNASSSLAYAKELVEKTALFFKK